MFHQPPFIAAIIVLISATTHVAGFGSVGRIRITANFDLQDLQAGSIVWLKEVIKDLGLLGGRVVEEQARGSASAAETANAIEGASTTCTIDCNRGGGCWCCMYDAFTYSQSRQCCSTGNP